MENNTAPEIHDLTSIRSAWMAMHPGATANEFAAWITTPSADRDAFLAARTRTTSVVQGDIVITTLVPL
jgi:hypothetical protein